MMYTLEERTKEIKLYIETELSENAIIKLLGYPSPNTGSWSRRLWFSWCGCRPRRR